MSIILIGCHSVNLLLPQQQFVQYYNFAFPKLLRIQSL